jgi:hypothetical protein
MFNTQPNEAVIGQQGTEKVHRHGYSPLSLSIKLSIEDALPGAQIKFSRCDGNNSLMMYQKCL